MTIERTDKTLSPRRTRTKVEFLVALAQNRRTVLLAVVISVAFFFVLSYLLPQTFESTATVLPPEQQGMGGMLSSMLNGASAIDLLKGGDNPTLELFKTIVESRSVAAEVAKDPKVHAYFVKYDTAQNSIIGAVQRTVKGEAERTGMFSLTVDLNTGFVPSSNESDSARVMSAYLANTFIAQLDRFNRERLISSAHTTRVFIEHEYADRMAHLDSAYRSLQAFQELHQTISLPEQLGASVAAAAKLTSQIQQMQMQLGVEQSDLNANSSRVQLLNSEIEAAKAELQKYDDGGVGKYVIALKNVPELSRELAGRMRETKVLEQVTAYLRQQLEQERISEQKDLPSLQQLDTAQVPKKRSFPSRSTFCIIGLIVGLLIGALLTLWANFAKDVRANPEAHYRLINFVRAIRDGKRAILLTPVQTPVAPPAGTAGPIGTVPVSNASTVPSLLTVSKRV